MSGGQQSGMSDAGAKDDREMLDLAARLAVRAAGRVEPNPLVGCVIVGRAEAGEKRSARERIIGMGHHRVNGGPHAEAEALTDARRRGRETTGATVYVTLEPCGGMGRQPPCAEALIAAKVGEVVIARRDEHPKGKDAAKRLEAAGIRVRFTDASLNATRVGEPFARRLATGRPWVIAKWAQTIDGRIATRTGASKWISSERSRLAVHRLRGRVDAILTGIGTARADDPELIARGVSRRRVARRVVIDPRLSLASSSRLAGSIERAPLTVLSTATAMDAAVGRVAELERAGAEVVAARTVSADKMDERCTGERDGEGVEIDLAAALAWLARERGVATLLVEAGPGTLGRLACADLIDEYHVYIAPLLMADGEACPAMSGGVTETLTGARRLELVSSRVVGPDVRLVFRRGV